MDYLKEPKLPEGYTFEQLLELSIQLIEVQIFDTEELLPDDEHEQRDWEEQKRHYTKVKSDWKRKLEWIKNRKKF